MVGLIGESGSGKTTLGRIIMNLHYPDSGSIKLNGHQLAGKKLSKQQKKMLYSNVQMIFQDPYSSLNGQKNIISIVGESLTAKKMDKELFNDFFKERKKILFFSRYSLKEFFYKKYWEYVFFANNIAIKNLKFIINELKHFSVDKKKTISENMNFFSLNIYSIKENANQKIISKLNNLISSLNDNWKKNQETITSRKFTLEDEKKLANIENKLSNVNWKIAHSPQTKVLEKELEKHLKTHQDLINENKKSKNNITKNYSNLINNFKSIVKNTKNAKYESNTFENYNLNLLSIEINKFKIKIINYLKKKNIFLNLDSILDKVDEIYSKVLQVPKDRRQKKRFVLLNDSMSEMEEFIKSLNSEEEVFQKFLKKSNEKISFLKQKLIIQKEKDKKRDLSELIKEKEKLIREKKVAQEKFDLELKKYLNEKWIFFMNEQKVNKKKRKALLIELNELRKIVKVREKEVLDKIISGKTFSKMKFKNLKEASRFGKENYKKLVSENKKLEVEIDICYKEIKSIKFYMVLMDNYKLVFKRNFKKLLSNKRFLNAGKSV